MLRSKCPSTARQLVASTSTRLPSSTRTYALSLDQPKYGANRAFNGAKAYQFNWYTRLLEGSRTGPVIVLHHEEFSAERLKKLRSDIIVAAQKAHKRDNPTSPVEAAPQPTLTVVRSGVFGVALRRFGDVSVGDLEKMITTTKGSFAVLTLPELNPPLLNAVLRAMDKSVPPKKPKTPEELAAIEAAKTADPDHPGRRMKRIRPVRTPGMKVMGAIVEGRVLLPKGLDEVSKLPTLDTLRAQIVGLLSAPGAQIAGILGQAAGGQLARTLEGLKKGLEEDAKPAEGEAAPPS